MLVYALIGHSGTGKSHHAPLFAFENGISLIVDDGLLIQNNQVVAGVSAKREHTRFGAVKRALMVDPEHAQTIKEKIRERDPEKILLLATSRRMAQKISERLLLPPPHRYINIEEIIPPETIEKALETRKKDNRHVIPIPTFAIKKDFPGYLIAPLRSFYNRAASEHQEIALERSVVRPIYSSLGNFFISEHVITDMIRYLGEHAPGIKKINQVQLYSDVKGVTLEVKVTLIYGFKLKEVLTELQKEIKEQIEYLTGFNLNKVHLVAQKLHLPLPEEGEEQNEYENQYEFTIESPGQGKTEWIPLKETAYTKDV